MTANRAMSPKRGISKTIIVIAISIIIIVAAGTGYFALTATSSTTTSSTSSLTATSSTTTSSTFSTSSTLTFEQAAIPCSIDPAGCSTNEGATILQSIYEPLVWYNGSSSNIIPWLAQNYSISSNGTVYTFVLRKGIQFCDGTQFNASAVKFSLDRTVLMGAPSTSLYLDYYIVGAAQFEYSNHTQADATKFVSANGVQVIGQYEVAIHLSTPYAGFLGILASSSGYIVSPSYVMAHGGVVPGQINNWMNSQGACGTGPYNLQSYDPATGTAVLQANDHYWGGPYGNIHPKIQTVIIKTVTSPSTMVLDMKAGAADMATISPEQINQFINETKWEDNSVLESTVPGIRVVGPFPLFELHAIAMNEQIKNSSGLVASFQPFANKDIREAMAYAFNYTAYIQHSENGFSLRSNQPITTGMFGFDKNLSYPAFNLTRAKNLL
ncbi:MAG: hypothetical protein JRN52_14835, partial [Nitrososphaerota archaeon]|nr:hypothetical protein [Nitrososphaerota archaeon]